MSDECIRARKLFDMMFLFFAICLFFSARFHHYQSFFYYIYKYTIKHKYSFLLLLHIFLIVVAVAYSFDFNNK